MSDNTKLNPEEAARAKEVIAAGSERMTELSRSLGGLGEVSLAAYSGSGQGSMTSNYSDLQRFGNGVARLMEGLSTDVKTLVETGFDTDDQARAALNQTEVGSGAPDPSIARAI